MSTPLPSRRGLVGRSLRRFTLGSGPLKRRSDRVELVSRIMLALALLAAAPLAVTAGTTLSASLSATAAAQARSSVQEQATLLADAATRPTPGSQTVPTSATWPGPDGTAHTGAVAAPPGARAGTTVKVWVDRSGEPVEAPLSDAAIADEALVAGAVTFLGVVIVALSVHLVVLWLLARRRARRWEAGWAQVEPLWVSRFR